MNPEVNLILSDRGIPFKLDSICIKGFRVDVSFSLFHVASYDRRGSYIKPKAFT